MSLQPDLTAKSGRKALRMLLEKFGRVKHIQCDGGSEFKKEWRIYAEKSGCKVRVSKPYKKNEQAYIESFNDSLRRECTGWKKYRKEERERLGREIIDFLNYYHFERPHMGLNMKTPKEVIQEYNKNKCRISG